ncbi:Cmx/CmrA family chloramphenicol efflux MFS transporter [Actinomadura litoris]|uniref:Cmx/CmrA family chloramphenicol efflux MFS transporter n=1 Tax=Actinomadura litoris TaxID=2678616 RepID=A0A7K1KUY1_9ACTN|nr:Cmx/CmrA family chloramphenicol efflux MFS transporter [Actinomadura litoris]MUN35845.1 Cmx/CmrA family chloramphenicol efflux MFS transporter [Actinomadura litoris]
MPLPLYLLALAVFAMGTSEFMLAGLVPDIAGSLGVSAGTAGTLTSAFAIGMCAGAPLMAGLIRDRPGRTSLPGFVLVFAAAHVAGALTTDFALLFATRIVAALANAGFLAVALTTASALVAPERKGRALAVLLAGTTVATIAGVPGGTVLGALFGWRAAFWAVAALCLPALAGIVAGVPGRPVQGEGADGRALRPELARLKSPRLVLVMLLGALVNAGTFCGFTFLALIVADERWVPVVLVLFGAGSFAGVGVAGRLSDRRPGLVVAVGGPPLLIGWPALALLADQRAVLLVLVFVLGALSFALGSTLIARVLYEAAGAPRMAGSYATAALNLGAVVGPLIGAAALGGGTAGPFWASGALVATALVVALPSRAAIAGEASTPAR